MRCFTRRCHRHLLIFVCAVFLGLPAPATSGERLPVVASFSVLADFVREIGGQRVDVSPLVGPDEDTHVYVPKPAAVKRLARAKLFFVNGLVLEGWLVRLLQAVRTDARLVTLSKGIQPLSVEAASGADDAGRGHQQSPQPQSHGGYGHSPVDPHAWLSVKNAMVYVRNVRKALCVADREGCLEYANRERDYRGRLERLDADIRAAIQRVPAGRRKVVVPHLALNYFAREYGLELFTPGGISTDMALSAADLARLVSILRENRIHAIFVENISDPRLLAQLAREVGRKPSGKLYFDALSSPGGPAATYIQMMRYNTARLVEAMSR